MNNIQQKILQSEIYSNMKQLSIYDYILLYLQAEDILTEIFHVQIDENTNYFDKIIRKAANTFQIKYLDNSIDINENLNEINKYIDLKLFTKEYLKYLFLFIQEQTKQIFNVKIFIDDLLNSLSINRFSFYRIPNQAITIILNRLKENNPKINANRLPDTWYKLTDEECPIHSEKNSIIYPTVFSSIRTTPLVVLDNEVLQGDKDDHHNDLINRHRKKLNIENIDNNILTYQDGTFNILEEFHASNIGIGSGFKDVALLEYVTNKAEESYDEGRLLPNNGDLNLIANSLKNKGYKKVFIQTDSPWSGKNYERVAKRLMKKI